MTSIDKLIALAEEHDAKATKGPWKEDRALDIIAPDADVIIGDVRIVVGEGVMITPEDSDFIAASRLAWPTTAKALKVAREELRNIATRGNNCACASHGWAKQAISEIDRISASMLDIYKP